MCHLLHSDAYTSYGLLTLQLVQEQHVAQGLGVHDLNLLEGRARLEDHLVDVVLDDALICGRCAMD